MKKIYVILLTLICLMGFGLSFNKVEAAATTVTKTVNQLVTENGWTVSSGSNVKTIAKSFKLDSIVTVSTEGTGNSGSIWGTDTHDWRLYQTTNANLIISVSEGYSISEIIIKYTSSNNGILKDSKNSNVTSETKIENLDGIRFEYTVGNTNNKTNGQVRVTSISVTYSPSTIKYAITYNSNGGTDVLSETVEAGVKFTKPADPTKESSRTHHYTFDGWYYEVAGQEVPFDFDNTTATANVSVYAKWIETPKASYEMFSYVNVKANLSLDYTNRVSEVITTSIVLSDIFTTDTNLIGENNAAKDNVLKDGITLSLDESTNNSTSKYVASENHARIYAGTKFTIKNTENISFSTVKIVCTAASANAISLENANSAKISISGNTAVITLTNPATSVQLKADSQARVTQIDVEYGNNTPATNFNNVSLQFKYEFDFNDYSDITESGFILTTSDTLLSTLKGLTDNSVASVNAEISKVAQAKKIVKTTTTQSFTYGINLVAEGSNDYAYCIENFFVVAYVIVDGNYYFSNELNDGLGYSVYSIIDVYSSTIDKTAAEDVVLSLGDFKAAIDEFYK